MSLGAGTLGDIFPAKERGRAMGAFFLGPVLGPILGPVIGGAVAEKFGWISIFWVLLGFGILIFLMVLFFLPETKPPLPNATIKSVNPLSSLLLLRYPNVSLVILYICIIFAAFYSILTTMNRRFEQIYGFTTEEVGYTYVFTGIGTLFGSYFGGWIADVWLARVTAQNFNVGSEARLGSMSLGSLTMILGLLLHGWGLENQIHYSVPITGEFLFGFGRIGAFTVMSTYLVDLYPNKSASITGAANFCRSLTASFTAIVALNLENWLGSGILYSFLACIVTLGWGMGMLVYIKGTFWRRERELKREKVVSFLPFPK